ncbi:MAG: polysaccharide biosynthesis protein [Gammaproteobacteria bacterium]|nr:polysaccharide biosynthesis protein [Gammaproteobacteria bacterium]
MKNLNWIRSRSAAFLHDLLVIPVAWFGAYWLRFNLELIPNNYLRPALGILPFVVIIQGSLFWHFGLYRGIWRFASMPDLIRLMKSVIVGTGIAAVAIFLFTRMEGIPRSVLPIYSLLLLMLAGGPRFAYRWIKDHKLYRQEGKKALVVGAGKSGEMLVRDLLRDSNREFEPSGFVDDNSKKQGLEIHGIRVLGTTDDIPELAPNVDIILIAVPSARSTEMRRIVGLCEKTGVPFRTLPRLEDFVTGKASVNALRQVKIDDLLGREAVTLEWEAIRQSSCGRCVLVSGGGGSIGSELCRQIARLAPSSLVILERSEFNLYTIDLELRRRFPHLSLVSVLGDVGDEQLVEQVLKTYAPDIIFHAAAYKHVPLLEGQARTAIRNNVLGTRNIARLAGKYNCKSFVLISTDKAVNPSNVMGATKHVAEVYCQSLNEHSRTQFITVRFGNVLGSAGSVIPLFQKQIAEGGPVTVTDQNVTRYFMTIPEAAQLILQASSVGHGGEIFVLDMGEPVNIKYLAEQLILLSGKRPGEDIEVIYTGLRPGEKPYEELFYDCEELMETPHPKTLLARSRKLDLRMVEREIETMAQACQATNNEVELRKLLMSFVAISAQTTTTKTSTEKKLSLVRGLPKK